MFYFTCNHGLRSLDSPSLSLHVGRRLWVVTCSSGSSDRSSDPYFLTTWGCCSRRSFHVAWTSSTASATHSFTADIMLRLQCVQSGAARLVLDGMTTWKRVDFIRCLAWYRLGVIAIPYTHRKQINAVAHIATSMISGGSRVPVLKLTRPYLSVNKSQPSSRCKWSTM